MGTGLTTWAKKQIRNSVELIGGPMSAQTYHFRGTPIQEVDPAAGGKVAPERGTQGKPIIQPG